MKDLLSAMLATVSSAYVTLMAGSNVTGDAQ